MKCIIHFLIIMKLFGLPINLDSCDFYVHDYKKEIITDKILNDVAAELRKRYSLYLLGTGGSMMDEIKLLSLTFETLKKHNLEEARKLYVISFKVFLEKINQNKKIRNYLLNHPFNSKNIDLVIFFVDEKGDFYSPPYISVIRNKGNILVYEIKNNGKYETIHQETYEEALKIVQGKENQTK